MVPISKNRGRQINEGGGLTVDYGTGDCISPKLPVANPHQLAVVRERGAWLAVSLVMAVGLQDSTSAERVEREREREREGGGSLGRKEAPYIKSLRLVHSVLVKR